MVEVLLFHHVQGLTPGVLHFAETLREDGHVVHTPDLFDGHTFGTIDEGLEFLGQLQFSTVLERGQAEAERLRRDVVYAGFSLGVMPAQLLAQTRTGAKGALFFSGCVPPSEFGGDWPTGVPLQIHGMADDPYFAGEGDLDAAQALVESTPSAKLFIYPGDKHLFADNSLNSFDPNATAVMIARVVRFLSDLD